MCHHNRTWTEIRAEADDEPEEDEETPSFLNDEPSDDVEVLTDGGDGDE